MDMREWKALILGGWALRTEKKREKALARRKARTQRIGSSSGPWRARAVALWTPVNALILFAFFARDFGAGIAAWIKNNWIPGGARFGRAIWRRKGSLVASALAFKVMFVLFQATTLVWDAPVVVVDWRGQEARLAAQDGVRDGWVAAENLAPANDAERKVARDKNEWGRWATLYELRARQADQKEKGWIYRLAGASASAQTNWLVMEITVAAAADEAGAKSLDGCFSAGFCHKAPMTFAQAVAWAGWGKAPQFDGPPMSQKALDEIGQTRGARLGAFLLAQGILSFMASLVFFMAASVVASVFERKGLNRAARVAVIMRPILLSCWIAGMILGGIGSWAAFSVAKGDLWVAAAPSQRVEQASGVLGEASVQWDAYATHDWVTRDPNNPRAEPLRRGVDEAASNPVEKSGAACVAAGHCVKLSRATLADVYGAAFGREPQMRQMSPVLAAEEATWSARVNAAKIVWAQRAGLTFWTIAGLWLVMSTFTAGLFILQLESQNQNKEAMWVEKFESWLSRGRPLAEGQELRAEVARAAKSAARRKGNSAIPSLGTQHPDGGAQSALAAKRASKRI